MRGSSLAGWRVIGDARLPDSGRSVGRWLRDEHGALWLERRIDPERHILRSWRALCIDRSLYEALVQAANHGHPEGGVVAQLTSGGTLVAPLATWRHHSFLINLGCGPQQALPLIHWRPQGRQGRARTV